MSFKSLGLPAWLCESLNNMKIDKPTEIQANCIPQILKGNDCIGGAKTGSGKTVAFAAPMLSKWSEDPCGIFGLILTPTRELAVQIAEQYRALGATMNIRISVIVGGEDIIEQALELQRVPHFVIATPGRLADHILNSGQDTIRGFSKVKYLVLDEADRLLSNTFAKDLGRCFDVLPPSEKRQTLLFTATVTDSVRQLKENDNKKKEVYVYEVETIDKVAIPSTLSMDYIFIPSYVKEAYLHNILSLEENIKKTAIVFVNKVETAELLRRTLYQLEIKVTSLHSAMAQSERTNSLHRFKAAVARVLIATDVASRGLDIPNVELVINYDIPADADDFVHRVGRTARAGKKGESISFVTERDVDRILSIEERVNKKMEEYKLISDNKVIKDSLKTVTEAITIAKMAMDREQFGEKFKQRKAKRAARVSK